MKSWSISVLFFIFLFNIIAIFIFLTGFHNVDLAYNFHHATMDCNGYRCVTIEELYFNGLTCMQWGFLLLIFEVIFMFLIILINCKEVQNNGNAKFENSRYWKTTKRKA
jgi:Fe2+ transport system protein B